MPKAEDRSPISDRNPADFGEGGGSPAGAGHAGDGGEGPAAPDNKHRGVKEKAVSTTMYLLPEDHRRLRRMAIDLDVSFQTLMLDAIDLLLARNGEEPVGRWETRRKVR